MHPTGNPIPLDLEPLSPELVLVTPELAEAARGLLPEPGNAFWRTGDDVETGRLPVVRATVAPPPAVIPIPNAAAVVRRIAVAVAIVAAAAVVVAVLTLVADTNRTVSRLLAPGTAGAPSRSSVPTGVFRWRALPGVANYDVRLYFGGEKVFDTWTPTPSATVPAAWVFEGVRYTFSDRTYRLYVLPVLSTVAGTPHYGRPIVDRLTAGAGD